MCFAIGRSLISAIAGFVAVAALACSSGTPSSTQVPAAELSEESTPRLYDPNGMMYRLFPGFFLKSDLQALEEVEQRMDVSQVVVLVEVLTRIPHLAQTSDAVNRQLSCFSSRYMNLLAVFQI